ncbi:MAG: glycoside hydrolase family 5 protein [Treponema sp.]|jgi:endoglucanase|nr:glycoside hydrolase family 5 protein [Treponema sp.]
MAAVLISAISFSIFGSCNSVQNDCGVDTVIEYPEAGFSRGVNLSGWFQYTGSARGIHFRKFTREDFRDMKDLGINIVRLPIQLDKMTGPAPSYVPDPLFLELLDRAVDWAEEYEIFIILDNHSSDGSSGSAPDDIDGFLVPAWTHMADHFRNRSKFVLYEILNEPYGGISAARWGAVQGAVIDAIRTRDTVHTIIVGGHSWNSIDSLKELPLYTDKNLLYTFHFYDPYYFTHQGQNWAEPSMAELRGLPFPHDAHAMPSIPENLLAAGLGPYFKNTYPRDAKPSALAASLDKVVRFSRERNVPVFCGEFGVKMGNCLDEDRVRWYKTTAALLDERRIPRTSWDYYGDFGLYKTGRGGSIYSDLNVEVVKALAFTPPEQKKAEAVKGGFTLYDDYPGKNIDVNHWQKSSLFDLYDTGSAEGKYSIRWGNLARYDSITFTFSRRIDWKFLAENGFALQFRARTDKPVEFDVRFIDSENAQGIPWRIRYAVTGKILPPGGTWHTIRIPLADMIEQGAWIDAEQRWLEAKGLFSWDKVQTLQFAAEYRALPDCSIGIDSIEILK